MSQGRAIEEALSLRFPRVSGDEPDLLVKGCGERMFSPRERG